ncbi:Aldo/keto reductase [Cylindrobasidium torrendii FP15055 ss-10]|uniref:Aldo/keto reductase n=1 Tax=Cylindrobasidium torrendii FP15055 ss-10 TaxID=1314674 RepID=A0A0D7B5E7_9AGAR|nr:Aldo/keto reductase [Cylindrobasidium torrendii FP15055 ss-10]
MSSTIRKIGDSEVSPIGFGAMGIAAFYGAVGSDEERFKVLDAAYDAGCRHWDTADIYGDSEELLGKWFVRTGKRDDIFLATKFGVTPTGTNGSPAYVRQAFEKALKLLGVNHIDLWYLHRPPKDIPIEVTVGAMAELVKEGKVKYIGLSECKPNDIRRAHSVHPIAAYQMEYSPLYLDIEQDGTLDLCRELGIALVAYSPLARGLVTGQFRSPDDFEEGDGRRSIPKYSKENFPKILALVDKLKDIGAVHGATAGQVTLAWILAQGDNIIAIPGTKKIKYLHENLGSLKLRLTAEEVATIRRYVDEVELIGDRDTYQDFTGHETPTLQEYHKQLHAGGK